MFKVGERRTSFSNLEFTEDENWEKMIVKQKCTCCFSKTHWLFMKKPQGAQKRIIPDFSDVMRRIWQKLMQREKEFFSSSFFLEIRLLLNERKKQTNMTPEDSQIKQVFLSFFTKTVAYFGNPTLILESFEFTGLNYLWAWRPFPLEKLELMMASNLLHNVLKMMGLLGMDSLRMNL